MHIKDFTYQQEVAKVHLKYAILISLWDIQLTLDQTDKK